MKIFGRKGTSAAAALELVFFREPRDEVERREHNRLPLEFLACSIGDVVDISKGGMRVRCPWRKVTKGPITIDIRDGHGLVTIQARIVRTKRCGLLTSEMGIEFTDVTPELEEDITRISMMHRMRRTLAA